MSLQDGQVGLWNAHDFFNGVDGDPSMGRGNFWQGESDTAM